MALSADDLCSRDKHTEDDSGDGQEGGKIPNAMHAEITATQLDGSGQAPRPVWWSRPMMDGELRAGPPPHDNARNVP